MTDSPIDRATFTESRSEIPIIDAQSRVDKVVVHARGAVITRTVEIVDPPSGTVDFRIRGISLLAEGGSIKVVGVNASSVQSVQANLHVPVDADVAGPSVEKLKAIDLELKVVRDQKAALEERVTSWRALRLAPTSKKLLAKNGLGSRVQTALFLSQFIDQRLADLDTRVANLTSEIRDLVKKRTAAALVDMQTSDSERIGTSHPSTEVKVRMNGENHGEFSIEYVVPYAAAWWPVYTLRLSESGRKAELAIEAFVAQRSSEDWSGAQMSFATSELLFDVRLPKLLSLRLGRAQAPVNNGYRTPPVGTQRLFESFDSAFVPTETSPEPVSVTQTQTMAAYGSGEVGGAGEQGSAEYTDHLYEDGGDDDYDEWSEDLDYEEAFVEPVSRSQKMGLLGAAANAMAEVVSDGVAKLEVQRKRMQPPSSGGAPAPAPQEPQESFGRGFGASTGKKGAKQSLNSFGPGDDWLNFDRLVLGAPVGAARGKLQLAHSPSSGHDGTLYEASSQASTFGLIDPAISRGMFDYRYQADGRLDVPSDGRLHRVMLTSATGDAKTEFRTVPLREAAVYREAILENPHKTPLLDGPVDVFLDGQFVSQTKTEFVAKGGKLTIGLGEEDGIKVSRNARVDEESAGLLGGKREITHTVDVELRSGLPFACSVELLDRIPVTDNDDIDIRFVSSDPPSSDYDQKNRKSKVRGGKRWVVSLQPGEKRTVNFVYAIKIKDKEEIIGGNRREP